jgi:hypothetical protein
MVYLSCTVGSDMTDQISVSSSDVVQPYILRTHPKNLNEGIPTTVGISAGWSLAPEISLPIGIAAKLASIIRRRTYDLTFG